MERSSRPDVRNPLFALESAKALQSLPTEAKQGLRVMLMEIRKEAQAKAASQAVGIRPWGYRGGPASQGSHGSAAQAP